MTPATQEPTDDGEASVPGGDGGVDVNARSVAVEGGVAGGDQVHVVAGI